MPPDSIHVALLSGRAVQIPVAESALGLVLLALGFCDTFKISGLNHYLYYLGGSLF